MIYFKACSKCHGDMLVARDLYGAYRQCVQCGRIIELTQEEPEQASRYPAARRLAA